jgi:serine/threonine-protein kinase
MSAKVCPQCGAEYELNQKFCARDGSALRGPDAGETLEGRIVGDREVLRRLGEGGMGQVYLAEYIGLHRKDALKVMRPEFAKNAAAVGRFRREAMNASRINHPNVATIYAVGDTDDGMPYMAMEYVDGPSLAGILRESNSILPLRSAGLVNQVAAALGAAHDLGIVHRDLKPENIMVTSKPAPDTVKLVDFGISKAAGAVDQEVTATGVSVGSPAYMSPEQVAGEALDSRTDIYSLGLVAFKLLTGRLPFVGEGHEQMLGRLSSAPRRLEEVRRDIEWGSDLERVMARALTRDRGARYQTAAEFARDFARAVRAMPMSANAEDPTVAFNPPMARQPAQSRDDRATRSVSSASPGWWFVGGGLLAGVVAATAIAIAVSDSRSTAGPSVAGGSQGKIENDSLGPPTPPGRGASSQSGSDHPPPQPSPGRGPNGAERRGGDANMGASAVIGSQLATYTFPAPRLYFRVGGLTQPLRASVDSVLAFLSRSYPDAVIEQKSAAGVADFVFQANAAGKLVVERRGGNVFLIAPDSVTKPQGLVAIIRHELATIDLQSLERDASAGDVTIQFADGRQDFSVGSEFRFHVRSKQGGFLTLVDVGPGGKVTVLVPSAIDSSRLEPGQEVAVPKTASVPFHAVLPAGAGSVRAIVTAQPLRLPPRGSDDFLEGLDGPRLSLQIRGEIQRIVRATGSPWSTAAVRYTVKP